MANVPPFDSEHGEPAYLYMRMADHLEARVKAGDIPPGARLPGERDLAAEYQRIGIARARVRAHTSATAMPPSSMSISASLPGDRGGEDG
jgi:Bacterial regulatory proteins, gntR family